MEPTADKLTQDYQCGGTWDSKVAGADDGQFLDLVVGPSGTLSGRHKPKKNSPNHKPIKHGRCERPAGDKQHIKIHREDDDNEYEYSGKITHLGADKYRAEGTRKTIPKLREGEEAGDDEKSKDKRKLTEEQWIATRPTNA
jgi:hypothetical protein